MEEILVGRVTHYYAKPHAAVVSLSAPLRIGDTIHIRGAHDDFVQEVRQLQLDHHNTSRGRVGQLIGIKTEHPAHHNDFVYVVTT